MPSKQAIIDNIEQYSAEELFDYIQNEVVSFDELCNETEGFFPANVRREVQRMLESAEGGVSQKTVKRNPRSQSRMPGKQAIIDNIEQYSATDLVEYIKMESSRSTNCATRRKVISRPTSAKRFNACWPLRIMTTG